MQKTTWVTIKMVSTLKATRDKKASKVSIWRAMRGSTWKERICTDTRTCTARKERDIW